MQKQKYDCIIFCDENNAETINEQIYKTREHNKFIPIIVFSSKGKYEFVQDQYLIRAKSGYGEMDSLFKSLIQLNAHSLVNV